MKMSEFANAHVDWFVISKHVSVDRPIRLLLTLIPSQRDTALSGRRARNVRIDRNAGISAAPSQIAAKFINDNYN